MQKLNIDFGTCVRVSSKNSQCNLCEQICPKSSISYIQNVPKVDDSCIDCGGCIGVCPTEAISLSDFDTLEFIFNFIESDENLISCKKNIPCIALLSVENLIALATLGGENLLDMGHCESCEIKEPLFKKIQENIDEANLFLESMKSDKRVVFEDIKYEHITEKEEPNRRDFLKRFSLKGAIKSKVEFDKEVEGYQRENITSSDSAKMREKSLPNKRKLFYMALKRLEDSKTANLFKEESLSFISDKSINDSCDNCSFCYRLCPTGALQSDLRGTKITFDALSCVKCKLCHDVCVSNSIKLKEFSTDLFFNQQIKKLISFTTIRCDECANYFTYFGGEKMCNRCRLEEQEAKSLWGIQ